ncbi:G protein alpha subunit [Cunninghamella echinulata]|nr:G protein alpha subunit [Cunninghamella echinulata]
MGLCISTEQRAERKQSISIDRMIEKDEKKLKAEIKVLLLGSGESGKSTIVKQMKILNQGGYSKEELYTWRITVYKNIMESALALVSAMEKFNYQYENKINSKHASYISTYKINELGDVPLDDKFIQAMSSIWEDKSIQTLLEKESSEFYFMDSAPYFFKHLQRIGQPDYTPNVQDVLRARSKTTGITESRFLIENSQIHMFDVGGQRSERKKWIHCFESVTSIIFCISLSEYDQVLLEESRQNRMMESLILFESVVNSRWFLRTSVILFLNKFDIFTAKIPKIPLEKYFPDYGGGKDVTKAAKYILWRCSQANRAKLKIYPQ